MKKLLYTMLIVCILLSGCNSPLKKISDPGKVENISENKDKEIVKNPDASNNQPSVPNPKPAPSPEQGNLPALAYGLVMNNGKPTVMNPDDVMVLVNKDRNLTSSWVPGDLVAPKVSGSSQQMRKVAADALEILFNDALKADLKLYAASGYRSYSKQESIFNRNANLYGKATANKTSAMPGQSEHQTGLAMDVSCASMGYGLQESFGNTPEGKWLKEHAKDYGFIIRYPKGKEDITKYSYEPWHIRYVGKDAAEDIMSNNTTFEEYFENTFNVASK